MGANTFETMGRGRNAEAAFRTVVDQARHENGHGGYTGTIAEKHRFVMIDGPRRIDGETDSDYRKRINEYVEQLINNGDRRIDDKHGPAGCICVRQPESVVPLSKEKAEQVAKTRHGETATIETSRGEATLFVVVKKPGWGVNVQVAGGYRNALKTAQAQSADEARGMLFAADGEWVFFGWASS